MGFQRAPDAAIETLADLRHGIGEEERIVQRVLIAVEIGGGGVVALVETAAVIVARYRRLLGRDFRIDLKILILARGSAADDVRRQPFDDPVRGLAAVVMPGD